MRKPKALPRGRRDSALYRSTQALWKLSLTERAAGVMTASFLTMQMPQM